MCVYIYVCARVCICVCVSVSVCVYVCACVYVYVCVFESCVSRELILKRFQQLNQQHLVFQVVRAHLFKFLYRFIDAPCNADLRQVLATGDLDEMFAVVDEIERRLSKAVIQYSCLG